MNKVFVYGTLLKGMSNYDDYLAYAKFVSKAEIDGFDMYDLGHFPGIVKGKGKVKGEIYEVDDELLEDLDFLENNGNLYIRERVNTKFGEVYVYVYNKSIENMTQIPYEMQPYNDLIYYVAYGSNMLEERFLTYIKGGICKFNGQFYEGCTNKSLPIKSKPVLIPYNMYYALSSQKWDGSPVCFLDYTHRGFSYARGYLISKSQFKEINLQEGAAWYGKVLKLNDIDGFQAFTFTHHNQELLRASIEDISDAYLHTLMKGLKETFPELDDAEIDYYLEKCGKKKGIFM